MNHRMILSLAVCLLGVLPLLAGCNGAMWHPVHEARTYDIEAEYLELQNRSVAILVATSDHTAFNFPDARPAITRDVTRRIVTNVPGVTVVNPQQIIQWQNENAYWTAKPPSLLIEELGVDRVVLIEIGEYRLTDPGDVNIKRGVISANVNVIEADALDPDNYGYSQTVRIAFPDEFRTKVGLVTASEDDIQTITVNRFTEDAAGLFYDHQIVR